MTNILSSNQRLSSGLLEAQSLTDNLHTKRSERLPCSSMPDRDWWESLWPNPKQVLEELGLRANLTVLDLGCGYGYFTIAAAQLAFPALTVGIEIDEPILCQACQTGEALPNCLWLNNSILDLSKLMTSFDYIMMHNIFHALPEPIEFIRNTLKKLNPQGYLSIINWKPIAREKCVWLGKPRGPKTEIRVSREQLLKVVHLASAELKPILEKDIPPYHYGITFQLDVPN